MRLITCAVFALFYCTSAILNAQVASYDFNGNLNDTINAYNGNATATVTFDSANTVTVGADGLITLPSTLNDTLFSEGSLEFSIGFRVPQHTDYALIFSASKQGTYALWQEAGFRIIVSENEVILSYHDGIVPDNYEWEGIGPSKQNQWQQLNVTIDLNKKIWLTELDGVFQKIDFPEGFDFDAFAQALNNTVLTLGGADGNKISDFFKDPFNLNYLVLYGEGANVNSFVNERYALLTQDLNGDITLTQQERDEHWEFINQNLFLTDIDSIVEGMLNYSNTYESLHEPLYSDGQTLTREELPFHPTLLQFTQVYLLNNYFVSGHVEKTSGIAFEQREVAPGFVKEGTSKVQTATVDLNGSYHRDVAAPLTAEEFVVRPTGYYVKAGDVITIEVADSVAEKGLSVIVGAHYRNMDYDYIGAINRIPQISVEFPLDSAEIKVANPYGGGIYLKVPEGKEAVWFSMTISNAIKSPYFSYRKGKESNTEQWLNEVVSSGAPWADFESDKFMITIPAEMLQEVENPAAIMARWDSIMDAARIYSGRSLDRPRAEYYSFDTRLVTPAYGAGYPLTIPIWEMKYHQGWNPLKVLEEKPHATLLHEMGHNHLDPTLDYGKGYESCWFIEAESVVHMIAVASSNLVYKEHIDTAFKYSRGTKMSFEEAAIDWMLSSNFRTNKPMIYDTAAPLDDQNMLHYQPRSWTKYADIARLFGWEEGIGKVNGMFYTPGVERTGVCSWRPYIIGRDEYIAAACDALGENVTPLLHFWGINPSDSLAAEMEIYPKSQKVKELIESYRCIVPSNWEEYKTWHDEMYGRMDYQKPRYEQYLLEYDESFANSILSQFDNLLNTYGLIGVEAPTDLAGVDSMATIKLSWQDNSENEAYFAILHKSPDRNTFTLIDTVDANTTHYTSPVLDEGVHSFQVISISVEGLYSESCDRETFSFEIDYAYYTDSDEDGFPEIEDCNDTDPSIHPDAEEIPGNDVDEDCDGEAASSSGFDSEKYTELSIYPNPAESILTIENTDKIVRIEFYDLSGALVRTENNESGMNQIILDINDLQGGIYLLKAYTNSRILHKKLMIQ